MRRFVVGDIRARRRAHLFLAGCIALGAAGGFVRTATAGEVVISQVYGGGGNQGATYRNDFVELFNLSAHLVTFTNWSVQYAPASGSNWQVTPISGAIMPGRYFLVQESSGGTNGVLLPAPDALGTISLSGTAGKVALVAGTAALTEGCPAESIVLDLVGYGAAASCWEGGGPVANLGSSMAAWRASAGCTDRDDNASDFFVATPAPRNSTSAGNACAVGPPTPVPLHAVQGTNSQSPILGQLILTTTNVVTALRNDGFFLQARDTEVDHEPATSEGIFVFTPQGWPAAARAGNAVVVTGIVVEQHAANDASGSARTALINATTTFISGGNPLPEPRVLTAADTSPLGSTEQLERFESMRVRVDGLAVSGPTEGFLDEPAAVAISDGVFYGVASAIPRPFREPGVSVLDSLPPGAPPGVARFDGNPELLRVDSNAQPGASRIEATAGAVISNLVGVLDFESRRFTILPDPASGITVSGNIRARPVPAPDSNTLTLGSINLQRFYDPTDDPAVDDVAMTAAGFETRLRKASLAIRDVLLAPDILGVVEMENLGTLQTLAARIDTDAAAAGQPPPGYTAYLEEGNDVGGIDIGFLVRTSRLTVLGVTQLGKDATFVNPVSGLPERLHDRPPLLLRASAIRPDSTQPFEITVILVHLRSLLNIDDPVDGARVRAKRRAQAEFVANLIQQRQSADPFERLACLGDFNAFPFNDGYVDVLGTIAGRPAPPSEVTLASPDLVEPDLRNLLELLPASQRYSYVIGGNAQALDHLLVDVPLAAHLKWFAYARCNADFPESFRNSPSLPERISDHDAPVACFDLNPAPRFESIRIVTGGGIALQWSAGPGTTNVLETASDPAAPDGWTAIASVTSDPTGRASFTDTNAPPYPARFYRLQSP